MIKILTSTWMTALIGAVIYLLATVAFWKTPLPPPKHAALGGSAGFIGQTGPSWNFQNPEADQLILELKAEKSASAKGTTAQ